MIRGLTAIAALALLAGCGGTETVSETNVVVTTDDTLVVPAGNDTVVVNGTEVAAPTLQLGGDGLWLASAGGTQRANFNASRESVVPMISAALGEPTDQGTNPECGAGPLDNVDYKGGLTLFFQDGRFVGWNIDGRDPSPYRTPQGIGIGSTVQKLRDAGDVAVQESTLGNEFSLGELGGLVSSNTPEGRITNLWAGTNCAFR